MIKEKLIQANGLIGVIDDIESEKSMINKLNQKNNLEGLSREEITGLIAIAKKNIDYVLIILNKEFDEL